MAFLDIPSVCIDGISVCVPRSRRTYTDLSHLMSVSEYSNFARVIGIEEVRLSDGGITTSDLCFKAASVLMDDLSINREEIDLLLFVSQSPDYIIPMTSCILQERLGLSTQCIAFDITSGCSGYVQGLSIASSMLSGGIIRKALLLAGDAIEHAISKNDKTTFPLFGSAGSATLLSFNPTSGRMFFEMGTDGRGSDAIMIRDGGCRFPFSSTSLIENLVSDRVSRCNTHLIMNGEDVFSFAISDVPSSIENLYKRFNLDVKYTDYYVFHQANKMILETIADIMDIPLSKVPMSLKKYGNTSSASIPMTIVSEIGSIKENTSFCLSGFGVGLSWGTVYLESTNIYCPDVIEI